MAQEMSESRKEFVDYMLNLHKQEELAQVKERINMRVESLQKELREIANRAYETAVNEKVCEYQQRAAAEGLTPTEIEAIQQERADFEADPAKFGIEKDKCAIKEEADQRRALEIAELLKDPKHLGKVEETDFLKMIDGYGERNKTKEPDRMTGKQGAQ